MNAAIRALTRKAMHEGFEVFGIERGYLGIMEEQFIPLSNRSVGGIITQGGTMLKTARFPEFQNEDIQRKAYDILKAHGINHLIVIGGDGSMRGATSLAELGMSTMTIPCTIDNDMGGTQYTIGFDTALNTVVDAVGRIRDTSNSHERVAIVEVMGRKSGHIALKAGLACGAEIVLVPEKPMPLHDVCRHLKETQIRGKEYSVILVAEGAYNSGEVKSYIKEYTEFDPSLTVLGYLQRGGGPSAFDAILAARMSETCIDLLMNGTDNRLLGYIDGHIRAISYQEAELLDFPIQEKDYTLLSILSS